MIMTISIRNAASVYDHGIIQKRLSVDILGILHLLQKVSQLRQIILINLLDLF